MKRILCRLGLHDWNVARAVEPWGHKHLQITMDKVCRRCKKHAFSNDVIDIRDLA